MEKLFPVVHDEKEKVKILKKLCSEYRDAGEYDKSMKQAQELLNLSQKLNYKNDIGEAFRQMGLTCKRHGNLNEALNYFLKAETIWEENRYSKGMAASYEDIGGAYFNNGDYAHASEYFWKSLKTMEITGNKHGEANCYGDLAEILAQNGDNVKALEYYNTAIKILNENGLQQHTASPLSGIGIIYFSQKNYEKAIDYFKQSLAIDEKTGDKKSISTMLNDIGSAYDEEGKYDMALDYYFKALQLSEELKVPDQTSMNLYNIGYVYGKQKKFEQAIEYLKKGLALAKQINSKFDIKNAFQFLSETYQRMGDYKNAYEYHKLYSDTKDSLLNEESSKQIAEMQTKYETEKKEQQITLLNKDKELQDAQLNRQKIVIWSVGGGLFVVLTLSIFIFRERRKSEKLLLNILPVETARELKANGKAKAKHYESVTVMFTDFKGFTTIAEKLSAEELVSELDFLFKKFDEIISKYNIEKIKTIGDAYMCASGLPTPNSNHAENIVRAALEIQKFMEESAISSLQSANEKQKLWTADWNLRIGIHSGSVTAGVVGDKKFAYDIWGDTVNTASRMESSGEPGKINISGATYQILQGFENLEGLEFKLRGKIPAKNKGEIEMYFVEKT
ncbi:MAG: tetratricopeptide repeat protein [Bacteroidetes bacterium]|nr:tetratricopeptide repeat protein [Bacteroidota bacterium]